MPKINDLTGLRFGLLTVIDLDTSANKGHRKWNCICDCGNHSSVFATNLNRGATTSCGCLSSRHGATKLKEINTKHGMSNSKLYHVYYGVLYRCTKENSKAFKHYGGRGISICDEWKNSFESFNQWAITNGYEEGLTIERIDNNGNYEPTNCKWIPQSEQVNNRRTNIYATINGETKTLKEWSRISGISYTTLRSRKMRYKWDDADLLSKPTPYHRH